MFEIMNRREGSTINMRKVIIFSSCINFVTSIYTKIINQEWASIIEERKMNKLWW